jgi:hypothetical protein
MLVSRARDVFDQAGNMTDEQTRGRLRAFLHGFVEFIGAD